MFQHYHLSAMFTVLFFGLMFGDVVNGQEIYYSAPTVTYSAPAQSSYAAPTYYPTQGSAYSTPAYSNTRIINARPPVRFRDPYTSYNNWYTTPPTFREYNRAQQSIGPNQNYSIQFNRANGLNYRNGIVAGLRGGLNSSAARDRDEILRARAFTESRGLTWNNGPVRGYLGYAIRRSARD
ncbi:hypothetical protein OAG71_03705 [bacterium]|nr:hypothetical protein [bacterium]